MLLIIQMSDFKFTSFTEPGVRITTPLLNWLWRRTSTDQSLSVCLSVCRDRNDSRPCTFYLYPLSVCSVKLCMLLPVGKYYLKSDHSGSNVSNIQLFIV